MTPDELDPTGELTAQIAAQQREYGTYVANQPIHAPGGVLAYATGHPVPISNVIKHGYWHNGQVDLVDGAEHPPEIESTLIAATLKAEPTDTGASDGQPVGDDGAPVAPEEG